MAPGHIAVLLLQDCGGAAEGEGALPAGRCVQAHARTLAELVSVIHRSSVSDHDDELPEPGLYSPAAAAPGDRQKVSYLLLSLEG